MESLYTKYRPQTFEQVVGQKHVVETLKRAVVEGRTSHAYLFCGPRGTGKTTMARLLAKALMCEKGPGQLPDGTCEQCRLIATGEHPDVAELDAASRTGVDNVREEILSRVNYAPTLGRCKVYIIDEVHMLTPAAFNALLKTLEEPPSHVVFIMCTTDPQKILATILSRVCALPTRRKFLQPSSRASSALTSTASATTRCRPTWPTSAARRASPTTTRPSSWLFVTPAAACETP